MGQNAAADLFMLRHVVERPDAARGVRAAQLALQVSPQVEALKASLTEPRRTGWSPRYATPLWALRLLAEVEVAGDDERIATALDWLLDAPEPDSEAEPPPINLNAIIVHIAAAFGFAADPRVRERIARLDEQLARHELPATPAAVADWLTQAAMALAALPDTASDSATRDLLALRLAALDPPTVRRYRRYGFPTFDQPDDIVLARSALRLGLGGAWLQPWVQYVVGIQDEQGLWRLRRHLPTPAEVRWTGETEGEPSRWLSAQALYILRAFYGE